MKINLPLFVGLLFFASCKLPSYVPKVKDVGINSYGAHIVAIQKSTLETHGELIMVDSLNIVVLSNQGDSCVKIAKDQIAQFRLFYARSGQKARIIPLYTLVTIFHGIFAVITAPLNLIVTSSVFINDRSELSYTENDITFDQMKMFARFPQGLPEGIALEWIK